MPIGVNPRRRRPGVAVVRATCAALLALGGHAGAQDVARLQAVAATQAWVNVDFDLAEPAGPSPLWREAQALAASHRERVRGLFERWADEPTAATEPLARLAELSSRLLVRYLNELSLWQADSAGAAFDQAMQRSLMDGAGCAERADQPAFRATVMAIERLPAADQAAALAGQRVLLERWGQPRTSVSVSPAPGLLVELEAEVTALRAPSRRPADLPPLPPVLAWQLLTLAQAPAALGGAQRCMLVAWWLHRSAAGPGTPAERLAAARHALVWPAAGRLIQEADRAAPPEAYPPVAARLGIEGKVRVTGQRRADGSGLDRPRVVARELTVPGLSGTPALAFETVLDAASLARAGKTSGAGSSIEFVWRLP